MDLHLTLYNVILNLAQFGRLGSSFIDPPPARDKALLTLQPEIFWG